MNEANKKTCPQFPYWGAFYADACCIDGKSYDLDRCSGDGDLNEPIDDIPCPFCRTNQFIECDPFNKIDLFLEELMEDDSDDQYSIHLDKAKEKAREWYVEWIRQVENKFG